MNLVKDDSYAKKRTKGTKKCLVKREQSRDSGETMYSLRNSVKLLLVPMMIRKYKHSDGGTIDPYGYRSNVGYLHYAKI